MPYLWLRSWSGHIMTRWSEYQTLRCQRTTHIQGQLIIRWAGVSWCKAGIAAYHSKDLHSAVDVMMRSVIEFGFMKQNVQYIKCIVWLSCPESWLLNTVPLQGDWRPTMLLLAVMWHLSEPCMLSFNRLQLVLSRLPGCSPSCFLCMFPFREQKDDHEVPS